MLHHVVPTALIADACGLAIFYGVHFISRGVARLFARRNRQQQLARQLNLDQDVQPEIDDRNDNSLVQLVDTQNCFVPANNPIIRRL